jgi:hypothetical protein
MATITVYPAMKDLPANAAAGELCAVVRIASSKGRSRAELFVFAPGPGWVLCGQGIAVEGF